MTETRFSLILAGLSVSAASCMWAVIEKVCGLPKFPWLIAGIHALIIFLHASSLKEQLVNVSREKVLSRLIMLYIGTTATMVIFYFESILRAGHRTLGNTLDSTTGQPKVPMSPGTVSLWAGFFAWILLRCALLGYRTDEGLNRRPDYGTHLQNGRAARALARKALPTDQPGLYWGGVEISASLARLGFLLVGSIGSGKTTLLRILLQSKNALPAIRPGKDCRAWILDVKREMFPIVRGIVGPECPVIITLPTDLRSRRWKLSADVKDDATCLQFAALFAPSRESGDPFWDSAVQTLFYACLIYLTRMKCEWDLRDVVLILDDEELTGQIVELVRDNHYARQLFEPHDCWKSIRVTFAVMTKELRLIAAMWDHATEEFSLEWWSKNPAILLVGTDSKVDKTLKALIRMMFKRTSDLLLAQGSDHTGQRFNLVVLDELPALGPGPLPGLSELSLRGRSGGTGVAVTTQAIGHIRKDYKEDTEGLLGQFFSRSFLRTDDVATAEWMEKCTGTCEIKEWFGSRNKSRGPDKRETDSEGNSEQRVTRPAFSKEDFMNMPPARLGVLYGVFKSFLGGTYVEKNGETRETVTTWFDKLSRQATFDKLVPAAADTPDFVPRPAEHQHLRPFTRADYQRLKLKPPSGFMKGMRKSP
jgi:hypothetical protein